MCFTRITGSGDNQWLFFDSMAVRLYPKPEESNNYKVGPINILMVHIVYYGIRQHCYS